MAKVGAYRLSVGVYMLSRYIGLKSCDFDDRQHAFHQFRFADR
jgi:hypothetical protein